MIDLRYFTSLDQYIDIDDYDQVMFVYSFASMTGDTNIKKHRPVLKNLFQRKKTDSNETRHFPFDVSYPFICPPVRLRR